MLELAVPDKLRKALLEKQVGKQGHCLDLCCSIPFEVYLTLQIQSPGLYIKILALERSGDSTLMYKV